MTLSRRTISILPLIVVQLVLQLGLAASPVTAAASSRVFARGELIVGFRSGVSRAAIQDFYDDHGLRQIENLDADTRDRDPEQKLVEVPADQTRFFDRSLEDDPRVEYAELNYRLSAAVTPNDPQLAQLWGLNNTGQTGGTADADIDAPEAWATTTGSSNPIVGIIDSGVQYTHPDLAANMWTNPGETPNNGIDDDNNGYVDDVHGINAITGSGNPMDDNSHGTHVAGTIGAKGNNNTGVTGVNWTVRMAACKFLGADGFGWTSDALECFKYFNYLKKVKGQSVVATNNSWGGGGFSQSVQDAMVGTDQPGMPAILHAVAAGNSNNNNDANPSYPSNYNIDNLIAVAATNHNDRYSSFSSYGATTVDLAAPGEGIVSTVPTNSYASFSGTSMATPHVAGAAALLWAQDASLTSATVKQRLLSNTDYIGNLSGNASKPTVTNGRLNVAKALFVSAPPTITSTPVTQGVAGAPYSYQAQASGSPVITWSLVSGPSGLTINSSSGLVSWTPAAAGSYPVEIKATNNVGTATQAFTIVVSSGTVELQVTEGMDAFGSLLSRSSGVSVVRSSDNARVTVTRGGRMTFQFNGALSSSSSVESVKVFVEHHEDAGTSAGSITWSVGGGPLSSPTLFQTINAPIRAGVANEGSDTWDVTSWVNTPAKVNDLKLQVRNVSGASISTYLDKVHVVVVYTNQAVAPTITSSANTSATTGQAYSYQATATGTAPISWSLPSAPSGMTINANTGLVSWTPSTTGSFPVQIKATNSVGSALQSYTLVVTNPAPVAPTITSTPSTSATTGQAYSYQATATGTAPITWSLVNAPSGMTINANTGLVSWTPSTTGSFPVQIKATNSAGSATQSFTLNVSAPRTGR